MTQNLRTEQPHDPQLIHQKVAAALTMIGLAPNDKNAVETAALLVDTLRYLHLEVQPRA